MPNLKKLTFISILALISIQLVAQKTVRELKSDAAEFFRIEEYHHALPLYLKLDSLKPHDPETNYRIGVCYYNSEYKLKGLPYFLNAKKLMHKHHELDLMLGRLYHLHHEFDKAIEHYNHHRKYVTSKNKEDIKEIERLIGQCETAKKLIAKPLDYEIINLGPKINSKFPDYAPVISADETELVFTSKRNTTTGGGYDEVEDCYYEDVYVSYKQDKEWTEAKSIGSTINTNGHDAAIGLSPDGQELFIYKPQPNNKHLAGDIYVSDLEGENWKTPVKLNENINSPYWESHASITPDEKTLYFTSNKPGGKGHKDIYVSRKGNDGNWGPAEDLSAKINTEYDEDCPFIHPDGKTLYFSSTGHNSMGGYDIFKTVFNENTNDWSEPENVGYPLNTADDDLFLVWSPDGTRAYLSSIRPDSYGEKDIYLVKRKGVSNYVVVLKGQVIDKSSHKPVSAMITVNNLTSGEMVGVYNTNSSTGKFVVVLPVAKDFSVTVDAPGYVFHSEHINVEEPDKFMEIEKSIELDPVGVKDQAEVLNNVFFDYDKSVLRPQSKTELDRLVNLLKSNKDVYVEIAAHTDSVANNNYNFKLSNDRAKSVVNYLVANGIDSTRLLAVGYGEDFPLTSNTTAEGRQQNRRSEFIFVDKFSTNDRKQKIKNSYYYRKEKEELDAIKKERESIVLKAINDHKDKIFFIKDNKYKSRLYFVGKKASLSDSVTQELKEFVRLLKENNAPIIVSAYTDVKSAENIEFIKKRLDETVSFLTKNGVSANAVSSSYQGDKKPIVKGKTESLKLNQRIEILLNIRNLDE